MNDKEKLTELLVSLGVTSIEDAYGDAISRLRSPVLRICAECEKEAPHSSDDYLCLQCRESQTVRFALIF